MFDLIVQHAPQTMFDSIKDIFMFSSNVAITFITLYTAWLRFISKRIDLTSLGCSCNRHYGDIISCTVENKTLSNFTIRKFDLVIKDKYIIQVKNFDEPFVIEPFKAYKIKSEGITSTSPVELFELNTLINTSECYGILDTSKGKIICKSVQNKIKKKNNSNELILISKIANYYNGNVLEADVKYALSILCESGNYKDIFIDKHGFMSEDLFGFNALPKEIVKDFETCYKYFKNIGIERGLKFYFYNVALGDDRKYVKFVPPQNTEKENTV